MVGTLGWAVQYGADGTALARKWRRCLGDGYVTEFHKAMRQSLPLACLRSSVVALAAQALWRSACQKGAGRDYQQLASSSHWRTAGLVEPVERQQARTLQSQG